MYTANACEKKLTDHECQFADDATLFSSTRSGAETAAVEYQRTSSDFGLTVGIPKTNAMVTGRLVEESDSEPIELEGGNIVMVDEFPYLGSLIDSSGRANVDVERSIKGAVFLDKNLSRRTSMMHVFCLCYFMERSAGCF